MQQQNNDGGFKPQSPAGSLNSNPPSGSSTRTFSSPGLLKLPAAEPLPEQSTKNSYADPVLYKNNNIGYAEPVLQKSAHNSYAEPRFDMNSNNGSQGSNSVVVEGRCGEGREGLSNSVECGFPAQEELTGGGGMWGLSSHVESSLFPQELAVDAPSLPSLPPLEPRPLRRGSPGKPIQQPPEGKASPRRAPPARSAPPTAIRQAPSSQGDDGVPLRPQRVMRNSLAVKKSGGGTPQGCLELRPHSPRGGGNSPGATLGGGSSPKRPDQAVAHSTGGGAAGGATAAPGPLPRHNAAKPPTAISGSPWDAVARSGEGTPSTQAAPLGLVASSQSGLHSTDVSPRGSPQSPTRFAIDAQPQGSSPKGAFASLLPQAASPRGGWIFAVSPTGSPPGGVTVKGWTSSALSLGQAREGRGGGRHGIKEMSL